MIYDRFAPKMTAHQKTTNSLIRFKQFQHPFIFGLKYSQTFKQNMISFIGLHE